MEGEDVVGSWDKADSGGQSDGGSVVARGWTGFAVCWTR